MTDITEGQSGNGQSPAPAAPELPLFYSKPEPLQEARFAGKGLRKEGDYSFSAGAHAVALHMQEFRFSAAQYPIVFSDDDTAMPLAILGILQGKNSFVDDKGHWREGAYVPAYVRRYPFVIGQGAKEGEPILYLDRASELLVEVSEDAEAEPLFVEGGPGERVKQALEFCGAFQQQAPLTQAFVAAIKEHGLMESKDIRLELPGGKTQMLTGLRIIDEAKFNALPDEVFLAWRTKGWVAAVYWHWASMDNFRRILAMT